MIAGTAVIARYPDQAPSSVAAALVVIVERSCPCKQLACPTIRGFFDVNNCVQYCHSLNLTTNSSKTNVLNISLRTAGNQCGPAILLDDSTLKEVSSSKFLGMHLDQGLTSNELIDYVCAKVCPSQALITAYYGLIYPHLAYGVVLWGACANTQFQRAFRLQKN
ncbi:hypothetical protein J6590_103097 [Homalodisca vitripennis]|nr:hypothetical protein J6590_103097 [Homalodisca vitripennis]